MFYFYCFSFLANLCQVEAKEVVAKMIIFSTLNNNHSFIMVENNTTSKLKIGHYNVGAARCVTLGTWGNISQHKGIWYNLESYI